VARNLAAKCAKGELLWFLDADDIALPTVLEDSVQAYEQTHALVYTDWIKSDHDKNEREYYETEDFVCGDVLKRMRHANNVLIPKAWHEEIGGYDETMNQGWEDWDYLIAIQAKGHCSIRLPIAGFVYMFRSGTMRENAFGKRLDLLKYIHDKWSDYYSGRLTMGCRSCGGRKQGVIDVKRVPVNQAPAKQQTDSGAVILIYNVETVGWANVRGPVTGTIYKFQTGMQKYVHAADANVLLGRTTQGKPHFLKVQPVQETVAETPPPQPKKVEQEFPEMPKFDKLEEKSAKEIEIYIMGKTKPELVELLKEEQTGKNRKGVLAMINKALTNAA